MDLTIKAEPYIAFGILKNFFQRTLASVVESIPEGSIQIMRSHRKSIIIEDNKEFEDDLDEVLDNFENCMETNKLTARMLGLIYYCGKKEDEYQNYLYYMLADLCVERSYKLPFNVMEESLHYVIQMLKLFLYGKPIKNS